MKVVYISILIMLLSSCGTISDIKPDDRVSAIFDVSEYEIVVVSKFEDRTQNNDLPIHVPNYFSEKIVSAIKEKALFKSVLRKEIEGKVLIINGQITKFEGGNHVLRRLIGFGAGSSYFDAIVSFHDATTKEKLGEMVVNRNSWLLGGEIAASHTLERFMNEVAQKIALELAKTKSIKSDNKEKT